MDLDDPIKLGIAIALCIGLVAAAMQYAALHLAPGKLRTFLSLNAIVVALLAPAACTLTLASTLKEADSGFRHDADR